MNHRLFSWSLCTAVASFSCCRYEHRETSTGAAQASVKLPVQSVKHGCWLCRCAALCTVDSSRQQPATEDQGQSGRSGADGAVRESDEAAAALKSQTEQTATSSSSSSMKKPDNRSMYMRTAMKLLENRALSVSRHPVFRSCCMLLLARSSCATKGPPTANHSTLRVCVCVCVCVLRVIVTGDN